MKLSLTWGQVAAMADARLVKGNPDAPFDSFCTDTRSLKPGEIFWALKGRTFDANSFLSSPQARAAGGWIASSGAVSGLSGLPSQVLEADDTLVALHNLAAMHRRRFPIPVAAVTGSNGKTTTKEVIFSIFSKAGPTAANKGNLNNHFGLPLSVLEMGPEHRFAVYELGASAGGEVLQIAGIARPSVAIVTSIAPEHTEFFGDIENIYRTETESWRCLLPGGTLVYCADDGMLRRLDMEWAGPRLTFGTAEDASVRVLEGDGLLLRHEGRDYAADFIYPQSYNRLNAAGAACVALASGLGWDTILSGLSAFRAPALRSQTVEIGGAKILLDAYNANPGSMNVALPEFCRLNPGPRYAVLGTMKELGAQSARYHAELGSLLSTLPLEAVFLSGDEMKPAADVLSGGRLKVFYSREWEAWYPELEKAVRGGGSFIVKASRSLAYEKIVERLRMQ